MTTSCVQVKIKDFKNKMYTHDDIDAAVTDLNEIFITAAELSLKKKVYKHSNYTSALKKKVKKKKWYDQELYELKRNLDNKCKLLQRYNHDPYIRGSFFKSLKQYRKATKAKARQYKRELINKLEELHSQNPKEYWSLVDKLQNTDCNSNQDNYIDVSEWKQHFEDLNSSEPCSETCHKLLKSEFGSIGNSTTNNELDFEIKDNEVLKAIKDLKNSKASGPSMILNEMIKYSQCSWLPLFNKLFNLILDSGKYPAAWSIGYISTIHKSGSKSDPSNYRGITICDNVGKLFNSILNNRLSTYYDNKKIICDEQIGFQKGRRTTDHMFVLNTLIKKYLRSNSKPLYACFVDFKKAFDSVWHLGLFYKLKAIGIGTKFYNIVRSMYQQTKLCVKVNNTRTDFFHSKIGVRQGDNLSPNLFNLFINDLPQYFDQSCDSVSLDNYSINCLMYADDVVLLSESQSGLQNCVSKLEQFSNDWHLNVNMKKTKVLVFNKAGHLKRINILFKDCPLECVNQYTYLGVVFSASGTYKKAQVELQNKGMKALFKLRKSLASEPPNAKILVHIFNHTIKPILLYGSEIWGSFSYNNFMKNPDNFITKEIDKWAVEKVHTRFCKFSLGVRSNASNHAARSELGSYPILYDVIINIIKYWCHLMKDRTKMGELLLKAVNVSVNLDIDKGDSWINCCKAIFNYLNLDYLFKNFDKWSTSQIISKVKFALKTKFNKLWHDKLNFDNTNNSTQPGNKLRTYKKFKQTFSFEPYLLVGTKKQRLIMSKLRISAHDLTIERGRYLKLDIKDRICPLCKTQVEDEVHFVLECSSLKFLRQKFFQDIDQINKNFKHLNSENKFIWLFVNEDKPILLKLLKFIEEMFEQRQNLISKV